MLKVVQIENALKALNPAGFQRLCDLYLKARGYKGINSIGLVIGADKVLQGTPDTLFAQPDGRYIFAEYSTQQGGLAGKFEADLTNCFNPEKTGVPVDRIHEVILCHNFRLNSEEQYGLTEICRSHGVLLSIYGLSRIAYDLYQKFPGLAKDFLGIEVDTGQIVMVEEFITAYSKSIFATPLNTTFRFRNDEIEQALSLLESENLILIVGHAGVGKTRFALECLRRYADAHPEAQVRCIYNRGADLFEDVRVHFSPPGHYVILVDDTNRVSGFKYILQLLHDHRNDQKIKVVATVRDYALDKATEDARPFSRVAPVELTPLKEEEIKGIVRTEYNIQNSLYLERILDIAQGNPRVAIMAAAIAEREQTLQSIDNVSALYDEYFHSMREELGDFTDPTLLQVAGLIAFFRAVDRSNGELMGAISDAFGIDPQEFWRAAQLLHKVEAVDMYEEEVVRVSDQVLSTYLFYLSVFQERKLDFATLLECFFPRYRHKVIDAINPVLSAFDRKLVREQLQSYVDRAWSVMQQREDANDLWHLMDVFWFVKQTETLLYVRERIRSLQPELRPLSELTFAPGSQIAPQASILSILDNFRYVGEAERRIALTLLVDYLEKRPAEVPLLIRILAERFGIDRHSHLYGFCVERSVIDVLWERTDAGTNELVSRLFLVVAEAYLHTHFRTHESKNNATVTIYQFDVPDTKELLELRQTIWSRVFVLYSLQSLQEPVLELFQKHTQAELRSASYDIIVKEASRLQEFFKTALDPRVYRHCVVVHDYLDMLERVGVEVNEELKAYFTNETFALSELLFDDRKERRELGWQEYQKLQQERLTIYTEKFTAADFEVFFARCNAILDQSVRSQSEFQVQMRVGDVLMNLADRDALLYERVLDNYLHSGNTLNLGPWVLAAKLIEVNGPDQAYEILSKGEYPGQVIWLFGYFRVLPPQAVTRERLQQLFELYEKATANDVVRDMDSLLKFTPVDEMVVIRVTRILIEKATADPGFGYTLSSMFAHPSELGAKLPEIFAQEIDLMKQAYFIACTVEPHTDYDGHAFNMILDLDPGFAGEWVTWKYKGKEWLSRYDDSRDYSFLWRRGDFATVIPLVIKAAHTASPMPFDPFSYLDVFFTTGEGDSKAQILRDRQDIVLDSLIEEHHTNLEFLQTLFGIISNLGAERRRGRIVTFLRYNQTFEAFTDLPLEPHSWSWSGSAVPMFQGRVDFFESLLPFLNTVELLQHKQRIEQKIQYLREDMEREKKKDFMSD